MNELPFDKLGPYPVLQLAAAVIVLIALAIAVYRGSRDRHTASPPASFEQRYFFDGPIGEALKLLRDIRNIHNEIKAHVEPLGELTRNTNRELGEIKDEIQSLKEIKSRRR